MDKLCFPMIVSAVGLLGITAPALAAPPDQIYEFTVLSDTLQTPLFCEPPCFCPICTFSEGPAPYLLATLTLTHDALTHHVAQLEASEELGAPVTTQIDDGRVVSFVVPQSLRTSLTVPPVAVDLFNNVNFDLVITGDHLSGSTDVQRLHPTGAAGCTLDMRGNNGNWSGTWRCGSPATTTLHSFTAIATRVGHEHEHDKVSER
jgi:hypothetical protein